MAENQPDENAMGTSEDVELIEAPMAAKVAAPLIALAATWVVRQVMERGYTRITGTKPPHASDREQSLRRVIIWAATTAAAMAVVTVAIDRFSAPSRVQE